VTAIAMTVAGEVDPEAAEYAAGTLRSLMAVETRWIAPLPDPAYAYDVARAQYSSTLVLRDALSRVPSWAARLIVLTERDLFIPMLSFVYGQAQLDGKVAVLSFARLRQEFYSLPPNRALFLVRVRKETLHEVGHTFGLTHCEEPLCTMSLSTNIQQLDTKRGEFCQSCALLLGEAVALAGTQPQLLGGSK
jgi:archaemetzincin